MLSGHARLFAVDLPRFGASERREDLLSPQAMGTFLAQLIVEADLGTAHLVGHEPVEGGTLVTTSEQFAHCTTR